ncbi:hypothetical protein KC19_6G132900 [Ceratodon purpureus]|uniref:Uncharacterized protein n=1 Tax=Ceratodon purpureus TaxID=3225 RepID=A0A8T0HDY5_CERPU|nr:hypothetical protein KC19_6G132900 [Ceratodon purpureus]
MQHRASPANQQFSTLVGTNLSQTSTCDQHNVPYYYNCTYVFLLWLLLHFNQFIIACPMWPFASSPIRFIVPVVHHPGIPILGFWEWLNNIFFLTQLVKF